MLLPADEVDVILVDPTPSDAEPLEVNPSEHVRELDSNMIVVLALAVVELLATIGVGLGVKPDVLHTVGASGGSGMPS